MDTPKAVTHIGLCAGYGGIELGLHRAIPNMRTVALCEIEAFAIANLVSKMEAGLMDPAPIWPDLKTFPWAAFRDRVDILTGGYPCQPFSAAGQRRGKDDPRHLWPYIADGIRLLRPRCCFFENVEGHISLGLSDVIEDLAGMGYRTTWGIFSASECGAPHQRKRVFILAHNDSERSQELARQVSAQSNTPPLGTFVLLANGSSQRSPSGISGQESRYERKPGITQHSCRETWPSRPGEQQYGWEPPRVVANTKIGGGKSWMTPRTQMTRDGNQRWEEQEETLGGKIKWIPVHSNIEEQMAVIGETKNAKLNPRWVETLMGLPVGWTMPSCASPVTIERMNSDCSETESCRQQPKGLS